MTLHRKRERKREREREREKKILTEGARKRTNPLRTNSVHTPPTLNLQAPVEWRTLSAVRLARLKCQVHEEDSDEPKSFIYDVSNSFKCTHCDICARAFESFSRITCNPPPLPPSLPLFCLFIHLFFKNPIVICIALTRAIGLGRKKKQVLMSLTTSQPLMSLLKVMPCST